MRHRTAATVRTDTHVRAVRTVAGATAILAAAALTACSGSSNGGGASPAATTVAPSATTTTTVPAATSSATRSAASSGGSTDGSADNRDGVVVCQESQLRASLDPRHVSGSSTRNDLAVIVDFTNTSSSTCTITGYPGAALENSANHQVKQATRTVRGKLLGLPTGTNTLPTVTLKPGAVASAGLEGVNQREVGAAQAGCDASYPRILVTPPDTRTAVPFAMKWPVCFSFTVHPTNIEKNPPQ
ncbi:DUF4232 domain-containing protein [uncultured Jatrophihabitans sp.]|uniref:DUF4232 domain-containing protein n=1 Tax=uncultured Jatrophihabitans sp. TaxID=1610747 RepID=UPI0035CA3AA6